LAAYTLVEMLTTIAALLIVLGLMMNLARHVRASSATALTKELLRRLDYAMNQYLRRDDNNLPDAAPFIANGPFADDAPLARRADINNQAIVRLLRTNHLLPADGFDDLPASCYDGQSMHDAWGTPIVFMTRMNPAVGMAAQGWFFFSAGPDRKYTTKSDNLYSYELPTTEPSQR
jgi:hypothetical protein